MDDQHLEYTQEIDFLIRMFMQNHRHERQFPGVLGIIFAPRNIQKWGPPYHLFQFFYFKNELELLSQSGIRHKFCKFALMQI